MPRRNTAVKGKLTSVGLVDLHFHGAFGIDLMRADPAELNELSRRLWQNGIAAFCPTTLSASESELLDAVERIGSWMKLASRKGTRGARPLGIHLEGPFINPKSAGAHPASIIRPARLKELNRLWDASQGTLKILTVAPETLSTGELKALTRWAKARSVVLSLGHSQATEEQSEKAFAAGFSGITHAWNALPFHHRNPGAMGAALGRKNIYIEIIVDQVHVSPTLIRWTCALHRPNPICFVSDCAPAAATKNSWCTFGPLRNRFEKGASRLPDGNLAGGGLLLSEAFARWLNLEAQYAPPGAPRGESSEAVLKFYLPFVTQNPLRALGLRPSCISDRRVSWANSSFRPVPVSVRESI